MVDAKRRGIEDRVNFVGYTNEPEKYYLNSSVFLLPSPMYLTLNVSL